MWPPLRLSCHTLLLLICLDGTTRKSATCDEFIPKVYTILSESQESAGMACISGACCISDHTNMASAEHLWVERNIQFAHAVACINVRNVERLVVSSA